MGIFGYSIKKVPEAELKEKAQGKHYLIIGGTSGIGKALAVSLLKRGAEVTSVGRRQPSDDLSAANFVKKDLSLMRDAAALADELDLKKLDGLIFTNGIFSTPERKQTAEGIELDMAVSCLSRYAFVEKMFSKGFASERSDKSTRPKILVVGFPGKNTKSPIEDLNSEKNYSAFAAHMNTVNGNEVLVDYLADKMPEVDVFGINPGLIQTEIRDNILGKGSWTSYIMEGIIGLAFQNAEKYSENVLLQTLFSEQYEGKSKTLFDSDGSLLKPSPFLTPERRKIVLDGSMALLEKALSAKLDQ